MNYDKENERYQKLGEPAGLRRSQMNEESLPGARVKFWVQEAFGLPQAPQYITISWQSGLTIK